MNPAVLVLCLCGFALLGSLPFAFFRPGRLNRGWALTAAPFFIDALLLVAALAGVALPAALPAAYTSALAVAAVPLAAAAIALTACTTGVHHAPVSLWHQDNDTPHALVTSGPYARIRHPFYTSFIVLLTATAAALPNAITVAMLAAGTIQLYRTARREELRLLASHGPEYALYMTRTGRFLPAPTQSGHLILRPPTGSTDSTAGARSPVATPLADPRQ